jgi:DNA processing protein
MSARRFELRIGDPGYPPCLMESPRPPKVLYGIGDPAALTPGLAVIGSRKATPYGLACAQRFAGWAAEHGVNVVSGAAIGCDLAAQRAALATGSRTIAVLGCGADVDYPRRAAGLLAELRAGSGAVVSELAWGVPPMRGHFPARNRIIAGLSAAVLVVEAALPSGTFSTADHALACGRAVLAVPGSVLFAGSAGCNRLLRQGAGVIACIEDLADELVDVGLLDACIASASSAHAPTLDAAVAPTDRVLRAVLSDPMTPDAVALALDMEPAELFRHLARLELRGWIARYPDGRFGPCFRG